MWFGKTNLRGHIMDSKSMERAMGKDAETSVKSQTVEKDSDSRQWVTFKINNELFAVEAMQVKEALKYSDITPVPGSKPFICGILNLRGKVITIIDARLMFTLPSKEPDDDTNIILVDFNQEELVGFVVDSVEEVFTIMTKSIEVAPKAPSIGDKNNGYIKGVTFYNNEMVIILDIEKVISYLTPDV